MNKYGARRTWSERCQRWFASKAECDRGKDLWLRERAGEIHCLEYQPCFVLSKQPKITITLDFAYEVRPYIVTTSPESEIRYLEPEKVYEDVKGVLTRDFRTKLVWLKQLHGIDVKLIR